MRKCLDTRLSCTKHCFCVLKIPHITELWPLEHIQVVVCEDRN